MSQHTFDKLSIAAGLQKAVREMGFEEMTQIQEKAIPVIRSGADLVARSQTGTGKTVAFGIPAVEAIDKEEKQIQVLILSPTRELAAQAADEIRKLAKYLPYVNTADVYGGTSMERQILALRHANLVIGTPGRIMDHLRRGTMDIRGVKMIVLDEADEMLDMGFKEDVETILMDVPGERQTVLFSATMPPPILEITRQFQKNPVLIEINRDQITIDSIGQYYVEAPVGGKERVLELILHYENPERAIIFTNTKTMVDELARFLQERGFGAEGLHGDMKQVQRTRVMQLFKSGRLTILIATDVAARGIDVSDVDYVINYDIPRFSEHYVHRIGRTGRAGKSGQAISICCGKRQVRQLLQLVRESRSSVSEMKIPTVAEIRERLWDSDCRAIREAADRGIGEPYQKMIAQLAEEGYAAERIAAALAQLYFMHRTDALADIAPPRPGNARGRQGRPFSQRAKPEGPGPEGRRPRRDGAAGRSGPRKKCEEKK